MKENREIEPIRPRRAAAEDEAKGETPKWDWNEIYSHVTAKTPDTIRIQPQGLQSEIELSRTILADQASGVVKISYSVPDQIQSFPSSYGQPADVPVNLPVSVDRAFSVYDSRSLDFADAVEELKDRARTAFRPRQKSIVSHTVRTAGSVEELYAQILRASGQRTDRAVPQGSPVWDSVS